MKGQSAIEYLTTYGWMVLAVAVVGGIAYANIQASCTRTYADFYTDAVSVEDFGLDGAGDFAVSLKNDRYQELDFNSINITIRDEYRAETGLSLNLKPGESGQIGVSGFDSSQSCNTLQVDLNFDRGNLSNQEATGIVNAPIQIN